MRYLHCCCVRLQMIVDPAAEDRRFHGSRPRLRKCLQPGVQLPARRANLALLVNLTAGILYAIADRLLVQIQSDSCADPVRCNTYVLYMYKHISVKKKSSNPWGQFFKIVTANLIHPGRKEPFQISFGSDQRQMP